MTTPKIQTVKTGGTRFYIPEGAAGPRYPGVTSILDVLPKPALRRWAEGRVAERAIDDLGAWVSMVARGDRDEALRYLKGAPYAKSNKSAAEKGTQLHDLFETLAAGGKVLKREVHPDLWPEVVHFKEFLKVAEPEFHEIEATVFSESPRYAGSLDALATINAPQPDGTVERATVILDYKTGKGVYPETALQLTAYATADFILREDGSKVPVPEVDGGAVIHIRPEGWALIPLQISDATRAAFEAACEIHAWTQILSKEVRGREISF